MINKIFNKRKEKMESKTYSVLSESISRISGPFLATADCRDQVKSTQTAIDLWMKKHRDWDRETLPASSRGWESLQSKKKQNPKKCVRGKFWEDSFRLRFRQWKMRELLLFFPFCNVSPLMKKTGTWLVKLPSQGNLPRCEIISGP